MNKTDYITPDIAQTLPGLLNQRASCSSLSEAYGYYDDEKQIWRHISWQQAANQAARIQAALQKEKISKGDRVAIMLRNCPEWIMFDLAALGLGLVTVPLYTNDRPENVAYVIQDAGVKLMLIQNQRQWRQISQIETINNSLQRVISIEPMSCNDDDALLVQMHTWLGDDVNAKFQLVSSDTNELATIVYTSGTTGRPKGVMLSHKNILSNAYAALQCGEFYDHDVFLSFLPLSHTLERTAGCYLSMMSNSKVCFARSIQQLSDDIKAIRPTIFVSVPRIYEMIYAKVLSSLSQQSSFKQNIFAWTQQVGWRRFELSTGKAHWHWSLLTWPLLNRLVARKINQSLGGRLRYAIAGGAALSKTIAKFFISLGVPIYQGYGMTESSPIISVGRQEDNDPFSIGKVLPGIDVKIAEEGELITRSDCVMLGYYNNKQATAEVIDSEGWLHTGDIASISKQGYLHITGRIKDIIVLASAEKVPPQDMETAICADTLFDQAMVLGEGKPFLSALLVLNETEWRRIARDLKIATENSDNLKSTSAHKYVLKRLSNCLKEFPGYAQIRRVSLYLEPWTIENGLLTPTLKTKRAKLLQQFANDIDTMYESLPA